MLPLRERDAANTDRLVPVPSTQTSNVFSIFPMLSQARKVLAAHVKNHVSDPVEAAFGDIAGNAEIVSDRLLQIKWQRLQKTAYEPQAKVLKDVFPKLPENKVQFTASWGDDRWNGIYGQNLQPSHSVYSPTVRIDKADGLYSLMFTDLDCPDPLLGVYQEWCHWHMFVFSLIAERISRSKANWKFCRECLPLCKR